jgi:hypothetical protein
LGAIAITTGYRSEHKRLELEDTAVSTIPINWIQSLTANKLDTDLENKGQEPPDAIVATLD